MLIIGAKGFAKEVLEVLYQNQQTDNVYFYDDVTPNFPDKLFDKFNVLKSENEAKDYFKKIDNKFTIGIGNPKLRKLLYDMFTKLGGEFTSVISNDAEIGNYGVNIGNGCNILGGVKISNDVIIGNGCLIYYNSIITHDVKIGNFVEISPGATLLGRCTIGNSVQIGSGAIIFPDIIIEDYAIIAAGAVVRENVPINSMVAGVPAVIKKKL